MLPAISSRSFLHPRQTVGPTGEAAPDLGKLDLLGRVPIPLRRAFSEGITQIRVRHQLATGRSLACQLLTGSQWYQPFDQLACAPTADQMPSLLVSTLAEDLITPGTLLAYAGGPASPQVLHPACQQAKLFDPMRTFHPFAFVPFVVLVDTHRLRGRPMPRSWSDLLHARWHREIIFGGRPPASGQGSRNFNEFLLLCLYAEFGLAGLTAFAHNVKTLVPTAGMARLMGSDDDSVGAIAILPWLHAELSPRRERVRVLWPEDGAFALPVVYMARPSCARQVSPLLAYLTGDELAAHLCRHYYPSAFGAESDGLPRGARLKWYGWSYAFDRDLAEENRRAAEIFFSHWAGGTETRTGELSPAVTAAGGLREAQAGVLPA